MPYNVKYIDEEKVISTEEIKSFRKENLDLNLKISNACSLPGENRLVIGDGVFDYEGYLRSKVKILWIMKEPYDQGGGGWHISDMYHKGIFGAARTTWYPIVNVSHAILSGLEKWDSREKVSKRHKTTAQVLQHIAYINVQKLPSLTRQMTKNHVIHAAFNNKEINEFLKEQIELLNPDIIIGANTLWMMFEHFGLKGEFLESKPTDNSYIVKGKLFINAKHPANRGNKERYINDIIAATREWSAKRTMRRAG